MAEELKPAALIESQILALCGFEKRPCRDRISFGKIAISLDERAAIRIEKNSVTRF